VSLQRPIVRFALVLARESHALFVEAMRRATADNALAMDLMQLPTSHPLAGFPASPFTAGNGSFIIQALHKKVESRQTDLEG